MRLLSFVIPCYRSEKTIEKVINEIIAVVSQRDEFDYEIIAVNDCSPDNVYEVLVKLAAENKKIKVINLAKNAGKHAAVLAGYAFVSGEYVINLDDDFQCPVYRLWDLLASLLTDEADITTAKYEVKKESFMKRFGSNVNLWFSEQMLDKPRGLRFENFSAIKRFVCEEVKNYKNPYPYLEGLLVGVSKRIVAIPMENRNRADDNTSGFTVIKSVSLFVNGLTAFSIKPLRLASFIGFLFAFIGFVYGMVIIIHKLLNPEVLLGYSSMMAVIIFSSGIIMLILGMIGEYVGRIYISLNNSPQYVVKDRINFQEENKAEYSATGIMEELSE